MTVLHVIMHGHPLTISVDDGLIVDVTEGKIHVHKRPPGWTPPKGETIRPVRHGNLYEFPLLVIDPKVS